MDCVDGLQQVLGVVIGPNRAIRRLFEERCDFAQDAACNLLPQLGDVTFQYLGDYLLDDLFNRTSFCHDRLAASAADDFLLALQLWRLRHDYIALTARLGLTMVVDPPVCMTFEAAKCLRRNSTETLR